MTQIYFRVLWNSLNNCVVSFVEIHLQQTSHFVLQRYRIQLPRFIWFKKIISINIRKVTNKLQFSFSFKWTTRKNIPMSTLIWFLVYLSLSNAQEGDKKLNKCLKIILSFIFQLRSLLCGTEVWPWYVLNFPILLQLQNGKMRRILLGRRRTEQK